MVLWVPAAALTEFLGGSPRADRARADWIASFFEVSGIDETLARRAATLMRAALDRAPSASPSATDALVAAQAERRGANLVISGDRDDFEPLVSASERIRLVDLEDLIA
jgi:predicted nucleic acid-binding protein